MSLATSTYPYSAPGAPGQSANVKRKVDCIYLDYAASTPLDKRVLEVMTSLLSREVIGNAHAKHHPYGGAAAMTVQKARERVAAVVGGAPEEIIFTSGATESNNLAIKGLAQHLKSSGKTHIITTTVEHKSVLEPLAQLRAAGFDVTALLVKPCGMITADAIERALRSNTGLVCVQAVNNELGTVQPLAKISQVLAGRGILFHCDAAQALGKIPLSMTSLGIDFVSLSAHKVYGPQGIGALYVRSGRAQLLAPVLAGGGQEQGLRSGTLPVALCAGFGEACLLIEDDREHLQSLRDAFLARMAKLNPIVYGHREAQKNVPGILNIRFPGIDNDTLVMALPELAIGIGSACNSAGQKLSHVIKAITDDDQSARESVRISFGRQTTKEEMDTAAERIIDVVTTIQELSGGTYSENCICW